MAEIGFPGFEVAGDLVLRGCAARTAVCRHTSGVDEYAEPDRQGPWGGRCSTKLERPPVWVTRMGWFFNSFDLLMLLDTLRAFR